MTSTELRVKELLRERGWTTKVLAEKTGMSESYLTHIKNGTRRWNEDALKKLSVAFGIHPVDLFAQYRSRTDNIDTLVEIPEITSVDLQLKVVPVMTQIPSNPSPYNNQLEQSMSGFSDIFIPVLNFTDDSLFCLLVENNSMAPNFSKSDYIIISPATSAKSGDIAAVEYGNDTQVKAIMQITFLEDFVLLETVNHKSSPIALVRGKDHFRVIGKVIYRYQKFF